MAKASKKEIERQERVAKFKRDIEEKGLSLKDVLAAFGAMPVAAEDTKAISRVATERAWLSAKKKLDEDEGSAIKKLPEVIGSSGVIENPREVTKEEVEAAMEEILPIRKAQDVLKGRHEAIRLSMLNGMTDKEGDELAPSVLYSVPHGMKFERTIAESSVLVDYGKLEELLPREVWMKITRPVKAREVDEDKLRRAMERGDIDLGALEQIVSPAKKTARFHVKPIKKGDEIDVF